MEFYSVLRSHPGEIAAFMQRYDPFDKEAYYRIRAGRSPDKVERAAEFLYLNRTCWNGLYRVNAQGEFNVPYGAPKSRGLPGAEHLIACSRALNQADVRLACLDFETSVAPAREGDFVFFDPPYVTGHNNNGFIDYNEVLFGWADQLRLASVALELAERGVHVVITNAHHQSVLDLYPGFELRPIERRSTLAGKMHLRTSVTEALLWSKGIGS